MRTAIDLTDTLDSLRAERDQLRAALVTIRDRPHCAALAPGYAALVLDGSLDAANGLIPPRPPALRAEGESDELARVTAERDEAVAAREILRRASVHAMGEIETVCARLSPDGEDDDLESAAYTLRVALNAVDAARTEGQP